ncbi:MAG: tyrosine-type recombinase/integrase, partial [Trebonia sp.]
FKLRRDARDAIDAAYARPPRRDTLGGYASDWTRRHPRSERTNHTNDGRVRQVLGVLVEGRELADWPLAALRRRHAIDLLDHMLREQGRAATGASNILRTLSALAEDAITDEMLGANPFRGVKVRRTDPRAVKPSRAPRVLTWEQMHKLAACAGAYEPMVRTLADCGLRAGECFALRREEQDLREGVFCVSGSAWEGTVVGSSATKRHDRTGPIPPGCLALLRGMPARIDSPWLFPTPRGKCWRLNHFYRDVWRPAREAARVECSPQDFRHSWVTLLSAAGVDVADLADMAGHSVAVAQAAYRHPLRRSFDEVRRVVG